MELEYKEVYRHERFGKDAFGIKVLVSMSREPNQNDDQILSVKVPEIMGELLAEGIRLDQESQEESRRARMEIINLFPQPIFVEEIPKRRCYEI